MRYKILLVLLIAAQISYGQGLLSKTVSKLAKGLGKGVNVEASSNLADITPFVAIESNLHSDKVGTMSQTFFDAWVPGGDMSVLMFTGNKGPGFVKVDGTVTIDGKPVEYVTAGLYSLTTPASTAPRKFEITTSSGQKSSFTIAPFDKAPFKIKTINGSADNVDLDLTRDVVIELEGLNIPENSLLKVSLAINQVSIKALYDVAYLRSGSTITVPAAAFRNINIKPAGEAVYNYKKSYIAVNYETTENATEVTGNYPAIQYVRSYSDGKFANITKEPALNLGLTTKGSESNYNFTTFKANAFLSRPFVQLKKAGLLSFAIRGTTYQEVTQSASSTPVRVNPFGGATSQTTVTTITITKELPWEKLLEELYPEFMNIIQSEFGTSIVPVETITGSEAYKTIRAFASDDASTKVEFEKTFRDTKVISAFMPIAEGYGVNGVHQRVMNETKTDGLITLTLDLQLAEDADKMLMIPKLAFEIAGKANGRIANTKYVSGIVESTTISSFDKKATPTELGTLIRKSDLLSAFRKALKDVKEQEKANSDYELVWNLQQ